MKIIVCINSNTVNCRDGIYGTIDLELYNIDMNIIINDILDDIIMIFANHSNIALDNVNITILNQTNKHLIVAALTLNCIDQHGYLVESLESSVTKYVHHLSPVQLDLFAASSTYYPGQLSSFYYRIMDKFAVI